MRLTVSIDIDGEALSEAPSQELADMLRKLATRIEREQMGRDYECMSLRDSNGNTYGSATIENIDDEQQQISEAEALARVTGSVAATVTHERRDEDGELHTDSIDVFVRSSERPDVVVVRELYGDEAAQLVLDGWTSDSAINHVQGICDVVHCTHASHRIIERVVANDREETDACERNTPGCCIDHSRDRIDSCEGW